MKFNVVVNTPTQEHKFPIVHLDDNTPCIVGSDFCKVFLLDGGCTAIHPYNELGKHLCEVHPGDFIGFVERVNGTTYLSSYRVDDVTGSHVLYSNAII